MLPPLPEAPGGEGGGESRSQEDEGECAFLRKRRALGRSPDMFGRQVARPPCGILDRDQRALAALVIAKQRERGQKHRDRQQQRLHPGVERLEPEPEMESETAVNPHDQQ